MATLNEIFGKIVDRFDSEKMASVTATVQFDLGDEQHYLALENGSISHEEGTAENPDATITMTADDFKALTSGDLNPMTAFMSGKIKVKGDMGIVMKLQSVFAG
ncbi:MAG: SCP2 sterol-binding domain-containing protein [Anaerolineales bacterium]|nr:SCP2 sterol-binding domain-containing protein [Anaerolineales bacterium]